MSVTYHTNIPLSSLFYQAEIGDLLYECSNYFRLLPVLFKNVYYLMIVAIDYPRHLYLYTLFEPVIKTFAAIKLPLGSVTTH